MAYYHEKNLPLIFQHQALVLSARSCVSYKDGNTWIDISWMEMRKRIFSLAAFLSAKGIKKGDRIAIYSPNRYEWWVADQAILSLGAVTVPVYSTNSEDETLYVLANASVRCCFTGEADHLKRVLSVKKKLSSLKMIISFESKKLPKNIISFEDIINEEADQKKIKKIEKCILSVKASDIATIIYTSGTTGNPKGVLLTHDNIVSNLRNIFFELDPYFSPDDIFLSFLPLSHIFERTIGYYVAVSIGAKVAFAESIATLLEDMNEVHPTVLICVPRIYEKIHAGINITVKNASVFKKIMFAFAKKTASKNYPYVCKNKERPVLLDFRYKIAHKIVFSKVIKKIGIDKLRFAISGGGPLSVSDAEFFMGMGMVILEGFGLTETSPVINVNIPGKIKIGSVGPVIKETDVKLSDEGEILVKGPQVMKGYYKNLKSTKEVFTKDGFFKTGDIGRFDEDGFLYITGRIKDIIITSGGKNISPQNIESMLKGSPYIEQVALVGDRRKFISALIVPDFKNIEKWAKKEGIQEKERLVLCENEKIKKLFEHEIDRLTQSCSRVEKIKKFALLHEEWTQNGGELTPSQKIKRRVIEVKYRRVIDRIYSDIS